MALFIPSEKISEIQRNLNIIDIVSNYVSLKQTGKNFIGLCPFHHEKTPSFTVNAEKQIYKCFGCGEGGTIFNFLMKQEGLTFPEAIKILAEKVNIRIDDFNTKEKYQGTSVLYEVNENASCFFTDVLLKSREGRRSKDYLSDRFINDDSIRKFRLGYSPNRWDSIVNKSKEWGVSTQVLEKAGLIMRKQNKTCYDRFRNRLMFPIFDFQNRPVGFGARALDNSLPKYLNSPETPIFNKSKTLYGINLAKESIIKNRKILIMEGYTDVIMAHQYGIDWSIAVLGTALTREHVKLLRRYGDKAILVFDADTAGQKSSERNLDIFIEEDFDVSVVLLPENYDPYEFIVKRGKQRFLEQTEKAYDFFGFKIKLSETKWDMSSVSGRASAIDDVLSTAMKIPNFVKRELTIKRVAEEMSINENILRNHLAKFKPFKNDQTSTNKLYDQKSGNLNKSKSLAYKAEMEILGIMIKRNDLIERVETDIGFDHFTDERLRGIAEKISEIYSHEGHVELGDIFPMLDSTEMSSDIVDTISKQDSLERSSIVSQTDNNEKALEDCIQFIKKRKSSKGLEQARKKMLDLDKTKDYGQEVDQLLTSFHKESKALHSLKRVQHRL
ncbi:MAG: DNA primase [Candidatus Scalindua rubra]|uniref:DNA primase n=1 Tax=Candidatus Scalindua rubra TaxID=1872076 RepID=A0A1E3XBY3_9BACT|nr:MAG: DNA primase [Candidatus Scalindua rubra]